MKYKFLPRFARIFGTPSFKARVKEEARKQALCKNDSQTSDEVVEEVPVNVVRGYWETICDFWDKQPELERASADV